MYKSPQYAVLGYPTVNIIREKRYIKTGATIYLSGSANEKVYKYYNFDPNHFYILKMQGKGHDLLTGNKSKVNDKFHGISGCGLWLMLTYKEGKEHKVEYRLIGIMSEFRKGKYYCLIGSKIQIIIDAFMEKENINIRKVYPHF